MKDHVSRYFHFIEIELNKVLISLIADSKQNSKKLNTCLQAVKFLRHAEGGHRRAKGRDEEEDEHSNGRLVTPYPSPP